MRLDIDSYKEILSTITRNKTRSLLTGFGVFWGIFMLVVLLGGGQGMKDSLSNNFEGFATNTAILFPQPTTIAYHGFRKGRVWGLTYGDMTRLKEQVPQLDVVSPMLSRWGATAYSGDHKSSCSFQGVMPEQAKIETPELFYGRYINDMDIAQGRKVCVIGKKVYKTLFPGGGNPCGQRIRVDSTYYQVVGVDYASGDVKINGSSEEKVTVPVSMMQKAYNRGDSVDLICMTARQGVRMRTLLPRIREVIGHAHEVSPKDERSLMIINTELMFSMVDSLFHGVNFLVWLVGIGTLLAGAIGVSNIMMVTVRERTTEIGIRRAIGATPRMILSQVITESILLTLVAGLCGIVFAVLILQMLQMGAGMEDGIVTAHYQVTFWTAIGALLLLSALGVIAGIAPALRAMAIKPVDAMREE